MYKNGNPCCLLISLFSTLESGLPWSVISRLQNAKSSYSRSREFFLDLVRVVLQHFLIIKYSDTCIESSDNISLTITMCMSSVRVHASGSRLFVVFLQWTFKMLPFFFLIINYYHHHCYHYLSLFLINYHHHSFWLFIYFFCSLLAKAFFKDSCWTCVRIVFNERIWSAIY